MKTKENLCTKIVLSIFFLLVLCRTAGAQDSQKATLTAADAGTCSATSTACLVINVPSGSGGATFNIGANASANTVQFEATADYGTTWVALNVVPSNGTTAVTSTTSTGIWQANVAGYTKLRMRCSTFVGGTTTTYINLSTASARSNGGGGGTSAFGPNYSIGGGVAQAQTVAPTTAVTNATLADGYQICWSAIAPNSGPAPTLAGSGTSTFSAHAIVKNNGAPLIANDIVASVPYACAQYNLANTQFVLQNPQAGIGALSSFQVYGPAAQGTRWYPSGGCTNGPPPSCSGNYAGAHAAPTLSSITDYQWPLADGSGNAAIVTDGSQNLSAVQLPQYIAGAGLVNVMTATFVPAFSAYSVGEEFDVLPNLANTTTNPTLNVNALGAKTVTKCGTSALVAGDYSTTAVAKFIYDGTNLQLQNPQAAGCGATATPNPATTNGFVFYDGSKLSTDASLLYASSVGGLVSGTGPAFGLRSGVNIYSPATTELDLGVTSAAGAIIKQENLFGTFDVTERIMVNAGTGWGVLEQHDSGASLGLAFSTSGARPISIRPNRTETARFPSGGGLCLGAGACDTNISRDAAGVVDVGNGTQGDVTGTIKPGKYATGTNCSSSASPAVCGSAAAGSVAVPTGVTPTLVVNTTAVTANSQILFTPDESLGTKLSVTCNSTIAQVAIEPIVTARTAATSFTIQYNTTITTNPICLSYLIVN